MTPQRPHSAPINTKVAVSQYSIVSVRVSRVIRVSRVRINVSVWVRF